MKLHFHKIFFSFLLAFAGIFASAQFTVPPKPAVLYPVFDQTGTLSETEKSQLNDKLIKFNDSTSVQVEVVIVPTTNGEDINFAAWQIGEKWGIRNKNGVNNGVVFLIAKDDHTMSIQQGRDVEQYITASVAGQILDYLVTPYFKQGQFYEGINHGTSAIMDAVRGKFKPIPKETEQAQEGGISIFKIIIIAIIIFMIFRFFFGNHGGNDDGDDMLSRRGRSRYPGGFFPFPFPGSFGGGSFGGGSFGGGGGGFGGFGGGGSGGFGGGGASGSW